MILRFLGWALSAFTITFVVVAGGAAYGIWHFSRDLPDYRTLQTYEPPVMTRVHAGDGSILSEFSRERRIYVPIQAVPRMVINAFVAAEDKNFGTNNTKNAIQTPN